MLDVLDTNDANDLLMMTDEAHLHLNGYVNNQSCRYWAGDTPAELHQKPVHNAKVTVWCGVPQVEIFESQLDTLRINLAIMSFQQDGVTAHMANDSMTVPESCNK
ncbi:hypothetical protein Trydic_g22467 [Trypoxylus dichotomus]